MGLASRIRQPHHIPTHCALRGSLQVSKALIYSISSQRVGPSPIAGCVKDIDRLWNLSTRELLADFSENRWVVASRRHGNSFSLVNTALLKRAGIIGRARDTVEADQEAFRPTTVHITYITPRRDDGSGGGQISTAHILLVVEVVILFAIATLLLRYEIIVGAGLVYCIILTYVLLWPLQRFTSFMFAKGHDLSEDMQRTTANGAATDVHIVTEHWNASEIDVIVGYSSQLHALTNISVRIMNSKVVRWVARALVIILAVQAALLASLAGKSDQRVLGSVVWLLCYLVLKIPPRVLMKRCPDVLLDGQSAVAERLPPMTFSGRRAALAFIGSLPMTESKVGQWDWLDGFMPPNERRKQWEADIVAGGIMHDEEEVEAKVDVEKDVKAVIDEVKTKRSKDEFRRPTQDFLEIVKLGSIHHGNKM